MIKALVPLVAATAVAAIATGCASSKARVISTGGRQSITTVGQIDIQDFIAAGQRATDKLLASGVLDKVPRPPAVLVVSRIVNNTASQIDTDLLTRRIRVKLNESGKALTTTTQAVAGAEDPDAKLATDQVQFQNAGAAPPRADFSLSGKIIETTAYAGKVRQSTFTFYLSLTSLADSRGVALWEGQEEITKQGTRPSVGF
ncbi:MAG: penicillin-binding protein activator LpoB [Verrucomicrobia bacterium]|nr:penicillin-binding protein activator LpoB [Verrucomicrobiota bacterium]